MNEVQVFTNEEFGSVRTIAIDGEPWFVGKDIAEKLGYSKARKAIADYVDEEDKKHSYGVTIRDSTGREQKPTVINESGMYSLVLGSKLPAANKFKHWITSEVIPSIRKNGGYIAGQESLARAMSKSKLRRKEKYMNEVQIFESEEFGSVRTVTVNGEPYFIGKDVAEALGYGKGKSLNNAVANHVDEEDKGVTEMMTPGGKQNLIIINESGLYSLILSSKLPNAKKFKHWVTSEVLPSIRKHGGYIAGQGSLSDDELMAKAVLVAQKKIAERDAIIEKQAKKIEADRPKTIFADAVSTSKTSILIGDLAKLICQNGHQIGQKRLFQWMRDHGYLMKVGASYNMPTQRYMEQGLFEVKERSIQNPDGSVRITKTTTITGKGQLYFINKFLNKDEIKKEG